MRSRRGRVGCAVVTLTGCGLLLCSALVASLSRQLWQRGVPRGLTPGADTSIVAAPLRADGSVDFPAAVGARRHAAIDPRENAAATLARICFAPDEAGAARDVWDAFQLEPFSPAERAAAVPGRATLDLRGIWAESRSGGAVARRGDPPWSEWHDVAWRTVLDRHWRGEPTSAEERRNLFAHVVASSAALDDAVSASRRPHLSIHTGHYLVDDHDFAMTVERVVRALLARAAVAHATRDDAATWRDLLAGLRLCAGLAAFESPVEWRLTASLELLALTAADVVLATGSRPDAIAGSELLALAAPRAVGPRAVAALRSEQLALLEFLDCDGRVGVDSAFDSLRLARGLGCSDPAPSGSAGDDSGWRLPRGAVFRGLDPDPIARRFNRTLHAACTTIAATPDAQVDRQLDEQGAALRAGAHGAFASWFSTDAGLSDRFADAMAAFALEAVACAAKAEAARTTAAAAVVSRLEPADPPPHPEK